MSTTRKWLLGLLAFNGVSSVGGGLALMGEVIDQPEWVAHTDFPTLYFPGVVLAAIVGGSALVAAVALVGRATAWRLASITSGVIMIFWIVGEIVSIRAFHPLQVLYAATGIAVVWLTMRVDRESSITDGSD